MKNIWYKSHQLRIPEVPLFEVIIFLEVAVGLLSAFLMTLLTLQQAALALALINYFTYAYHAESIKILIKKMPLPYKSNKKAYLRYCAFVLTQKSDFLLLGLSKTLFLFLFAVSDVGFFLFVAIDVLISVSILLFFLLDKGMIDVLIKFFLMGVLIISYLLLEKLNPTVLTLGFIALSLIVLIICVKRIQDNRMAELIEGKNGMSLKNPTISFLVKGFFYDFKKNIFSFVLLMGAGVLFHHFGLPAGIPGLFALLTFFETVIYAQVNLYEKNIGYSSVLFSSQRKSVFTGVFLGQFSYRCFSWVLAFLLLIVLGFVRSPLQILACALWFFLLSAYTTMISEKIVAYRKKRPKFIEEYAALVLIFSIGLLP